MRRLAILMLITQGASAADAVLGPGLKRVADMADGAPAFVVYDSQGTVVRRVECINNHQYDPDALSARLLGSTGVLDRIVRFDGRIASDDLGPVGFDCVIVTAP